MNRKMLVAVVLAMLLIGGSVGWFNFRSTSEMGVVNLSDPMVRARIRENKEKVLFIGIDGMTWSIALELINEGRMPHLGRILANAPHGVMSSEPPLISPALWTTFATGHKRTVHGIDNFLAKLPGEYEEVNMASRFRKTPAIWEMASWADRTVGVVNWNAAYPAEKVNGVFVGHGIRSGKMNAEMIYPPEWRDRVQSLKPVDFPEMERSLKHMGDSQARNAYDQDRLVYTIALNILSELHPDLMMLYLPGIDVVSHLYWKFRWPLSMDNFFGVSQQERTLYRDVIENHYEFVDVLIGGLLEKADGYTTIILSDHGMGAINPPNNGYLLLNHLLERMDYLRYVDKSCETILTELANEGILSVPPPFAINIFMLSKALVTEARRLQERSTPKMNAAAVEEWLKSKVAFKSGNTSVQETITRQMEALAESIKPHSVGATIDWSKTSAWNIEDVKKEKQGIFINLENRDKQGIVPYSAYKNSQVKLIKKLQKLRTEKERPLFLSVAPNQEGADNDSVTIDVPDIVVKVNREALTDEFVFRNRDDHDPMPLDALKWIYGGSGDHLPDGIFIVTGKKARGFYRMDVTIYDITPTILWALDMPVGADMPGRILKDAFIEPLFSQNPMIISSWTGVETREGNIQASMPDAKRLEQLRALGYVR
jgi:predicted AlkP superfamily phosphohydrolase/phosphomutase